MEILFRVLRFRGCRGWGLRLLNFRAGLGAQRFRRFGFFFGLEGFFLGFQGVWLFGLYGSRGLVFTAVGRGSKGFFQGPE